MVPYNKDKEPSIWSLGSSSVQATLIFDQQVGTTYTNLDIISGQVVVRCTKATNITSIIVKLEGEARTRLVGPRSRMSDRDDTKVELEHHKILYQTITVFPPTNVADLTSNGKGAYTLQAGSHTYAWQFKLPFNNNCRDSPTTLPGVQVGWATHGLEVTKAPMLHVKKTLPPTLSGFPGEAEISYYVKATVARQGMLKENARTFQPFMFLPIEAPRPPPTGAQAYARQTHTFEAGYTPEKKGKMKLFGSTPSVPSTNAPSFSVDIRLPEPSIVTCNHILPLSILVKKLNATGMIYLQSLQVALVGDTKIRAHALQRIEQNTWIMVSKSNMNIPLGTASDTVGTEIPLDSSLWQHSPMPNTIAPSFETCNIARYYQVDVRIGLSHGGGAKPQTVILPLRLATQVFSGIALSPDVQHKLAAARRRRTGLEEGSVPPEKTGLSQPAPTTAAPALPARQEDLPMYSDAPPSYEDAIAEELPPVDGYRPAYTAPATGDDPLLSGDQKR